MILEQDATIKSIHERESSTTMLATILKTRRGDIKLVIGNQWDKVVYLKQTPDAVFIRLLINKTQHQDFMAFQQQKHLKNKWAKEGCFAEGHPAFPVAGDVRQYVGRSVLEIMSIVMEEVGQLTGKTTEVGIANSHVATRIPYGHRGDEVGRCRPTTRLAVSSS